MNFLNKKIKRINNADYFTQPLIIFTKGADIFGHDCIKSLQSCEQMQIRARRGDTKNAN